MGWAREGRDVFRCSRTAGPQVEKEEARVRGWTELKGTSINRQVMDASREMWGIDEVFMMTDAKEMRRPREQSGSTRCTLF